MKKSIKVLSLIIGFAICFVSLCTPALATSLTPEEEAAYLQSIIAEVDQFVYIDESNMFALKDLPTKYSDLHSEMTKSINATNSLIRHIMTLDNVTVNKDDKSFSSKFLVNSYGNGTDKIYWWGNRVKGSNEDCEKAIKDFEELKATAPVSKCQEAFINKLKSIQSVSKSRIEYDSCTFNISSFDARWCFAINTLKPCK